ncbi:FAD-dependent oxidoreductase [Sphingobacterium sp.]|uniref:FAD-dependent oxidoreductase n=1 Tax=Sphingobacterium sp. TaxID=341027 RepID=UPI0031D76D3F
MKNGVRFNSSRRSFLKLAFLGAIGLQFAQACKKKANHIFLRLTGTDHILGHRLRFPDFPKPTTVIEIPILILGGGITGLSAAYRLQQKGRGEFLLLDMESEVGGNARHGKNDHSSYPLGAHYLPIPNASNRDLLRFLEESKIIIDWTTEGVPLFDAEQLSFAPQERLFIHNVWQEGIVPNYGLSPQETAEIDRFMVQMDQFKQLKGADGKYVFDIPMLNASQSDHLKRLDAVSMRSWMESEGYKTEAVYSYVNYCCRDDYGTGIMATSAFAGIHYFASRKHDWPTYQDLVLTWQEGNGRLVSHLKKYADGKVLNQHLAYQIDVREDAVEVSVFDSKGKVSKTFKAQKVINCCPQFVNQYLLPNRRSLTKKFHYAPWIVATIVLHRFPFTDGATLSWENIIYNGKGLGYVYDQHQSLNQLQSPFVITYYHSLGDGDLNVNRKQLYGWTDQQWKDFILEDLGKAHYGIEKEVISIEIFRHGHGMISPVIGFLSNRARTELAKPIADKVYFAHSDLSGISIFEEAFCQGITAADQVVTGFSQKEV